MGSRTEELYCLTVLETEMKSEIKMSEELAPVEGHHLPVSSQCLPSGHVFVPKFPLLIRTPVILD